MTSSTYLFRSWVTAVPAGRVAGDITISNMDPVVHYGRRAVDLLGDRARFGRRAARSSQGGPASETIWQWESTADHALRVRLWHGAGAHRRAAAQTARPQLAERRY